MHDDDEDDGPYSTCANCGRTVFADVSDCPYCHNDPSGKTHGCSHCGRTIPEGVAQCPYCRNFTDERGWKSGGPPRIFVIAGWLVVIGLLLPVLIALFNWLRKLQ